MYRVFAFSVNSIVNAFFSSFFSFFIKVCLSRYVFYMTSYFCSASFRKGWEASGTNPGSMSVIRFGFAQPQETS